MNPNSKQPDIFQTMADNKISLSSGHVSDMVLSSLSQGLSITNENSRFIYVNTVYAEMLGYEASDIMGKTPFEFTHEGDYELLQKQKRFRKEGKTSQYECRLKHASGEYLNVLLTGVPIYRDGTYKGSVAIITDTSKTKEIEKELKTKDQLLLGVSEALNLLLADGAIEDVLKNAIQALGEKTELSKIHVAKVDVDNRNPLIQQYIEWTPGKASIFKELFDQGKAPESLIHRHWITCLAEDELYEANDNPVLRRGERKLLNDLGVKSTLIIPIFCDNEFWGYVGFDDFKKKRIWLESEKSILKALAAGISSAIKKDNSKNILQEQKEFYEGILNSLPSDVVVFDPDHRYQFINPVAIQDNEMRAWLIGKDDFEYVEARNKPKDIAIKRRAVFDEVVESGQKKSWEEKLVNAQGDDVWILRNFFPIYDSDDQLKMMIGYALDITDRKEAEEELNRSSQLLAQAQKMVNLGSWEYDVLNNTMTYSDEVFRMMGIDVEGNTFSRDDIWGFISKEERERFESLTQYCLEKAEPVDTEFKFLNTRKEEVYVSLKAQPVLENGEVVRIIGTMLDITRQKMEEINSKQVARFTEESPWPTLRMNLQGKVTYCNKEGLGVKDYIVSRFSEVYQPLFEKLLAQKEVYEQEVHVEDNCYSLTFSPMPEYGYINIYGKDITSRKQQEEELIRAREQAEESKELKQKFLANMSHEIRTPMNGVVGIVNLLEKTSLNADQQKYLNILKDSSEHLLRIINDILDLSKIEEGKLTLIEKPVEMESLISGVADNIKNRLKEKSVYLKVDNTEIFRNKLITDPVRLRQVLLNLLSNSSKFTHKGYIQLECEHINENDQEHAFAIHVKDTGIGIEQDKLELIFEAFDQANLETSQQYGGTGLGLNIVKDLVQKMGGRIEVQSTLGNGSIFSVYLNLRKAGDEEDYQATYSSISRHRDKLNGKRILIVDDHLVNYTIAEEILKTWGASVGYGSDGEEGIQELINDSYDLVLMDMQMPNMDGIEATKLIRSMDESLSSIPIIAMTAAALPEERERCLQSGMNDYVSKPFSPDTLFNVISGYLNKEELFAPEIRKKDDGAELELLKYDLTYLKDLSNDNTEFILQMVNSFRTDMPRFLDEIFQHIEEKDFEKMAQVSHKGKSLCSYIGNESLKLMCLELEHKTGASVTQEECLKLATEISTELNEVLEALKNINLNSHE